MHGAPSGARCGSSSGSPLALPGLAGQTQRVGCVLFARTSKGASKRSGLVFPVRSGRKESVTDERRSVDERVAATYSHRPSHKPNAVSRTLKTERATSSAGPKQRVKRPAGRETIAKMRTPLTSKPPRRYKRRPSQGKRAAHSGRRSQREVVRARADAINRESS
jgi:hypothetical protein